MVDSVKDKDTYEALREEGASEEKAAAIANAQANETIEHDGRDYEARTRDELRLLAKEHDIKGRGSMNKAELIQALREHQQKVQ